MSKKIKLLSLCSAICAMSYGSAVYLFHDNAQKILNNIVPNNDNKAFFQSIKERVNINAFKFQVNFLSADKQNILLSVHYNPLTSKAHFHYVSPIAETISIEKDKKMSIKLDMGQPGYLMSMQLPRCVKGYQNIEDLLSDDKFYLSDINTETSRRTLSLDVTQDGFDMPERLNFFPLSIKIEDDIRSLQLKREGQQVTLSGDIAYQVEYLIGNNLPQIIKGSSNASVTLNTQAFIKTALKAEKAGAIENWTNEQKEEIANDAIAFLKDLKVNNTTKEETTAKELSDKRVENIAINNLDNNQLAFSYAMTGTSTTKGRNEILRVLLSDPSQITKSLSAIDEEYNTKSQADQEKSIKELSDILYNTIVTGDDIDYLSHLNLVFKTKSEQTFLEDGKTFVQAIKSYQFPGEYELDISFALAIGERFALAMEGMLFYKEFMPHADLKVTFNEESYKTFLNLVQNITDAANQTSFQPFVNGLFVMIKSLPYETLFKQEKNSETGKEENVLKIQF